MKTNPRLNADKAQWLARQWAREDGQGLWRILGDSAHKVVSAMLYRVDEVQEIFARITAPMLSITASDDSLGQWWKDQYTLADYRQRLQTVPDLSEATIDDAGHMLHHDQPHVLAKLVEDFLSA